MKLRCPNRMMRRKIIIIREIVLRQAIRLQVLKASEYCPEGAIEFAIRKARIRDQQGPPRIKRR
jgi:hypothetical protein